MITVRLDEEKLEALRSWGARLRDESSEGSTAVGRAILMLIDEIDRLHIEIRHTQIRQSDGLPAEADAPNEPEEPVSLSLQTRLQRVLRREASDEPVEPSATIAEEDGTTSAQAWIAALRRED